MAITGIIVTSCNSGNPKNANKAIADTLVSKLSTKDTGTIKDGQIQIFYNMYLSVEMSSLFKSIGVVYNSNLLNPSGKVEKYNTSADKAMNLGVYAVDLSYCKYFEQFEQASKYLKNMQKLSSEMGIPDEQFFLSVKRIETNISNKDSLVKIANELYVSTDKYLKDNERGNSAALIILGGWTEALYIATNLDKNESNDVELLSRIAEQKYSLVNLLNLLKKYENDKIIQVYIKKLIDLQTSFTKFNLDEKHKDKTYEQLKEIRTKILIIRKEIVS
jgi:hypothetical protein